MDRIRARWILLGGIALGMSGMFALEMTNVAWPRRGSIFLPMLMMYGGLACAMLIAARAAGLSWRRVFGPRPAASDRPLVGVALPLAALSFAGVWLLFLPLSYLAPDYVERTLLEEGVGIFVPGHRQAIVADVILLVIIAPVVEEVLFRGILLQRWSRKWGIRGGVIASSTLFAILHLGMLGAFLFALALSAIYMRTRSLWIPIAVHAANNAMVAVMMAPGAWAGVEEETVTIQEFREGWWVGLIALALGVPVLVWFARRYWPKDGWRLPYER